MASAALPLAARGNNRSVLSEMCVEGSPAKYEDQRGDHGPSDHDAFDESKRVVNRA